MKTTIGAKQSPVSLVGLELSQLHPLPIDPDDPKLDALRSSYAFRTTGRVSEGEDRYGYEQGISITVEGKKLHLVDGRHRFTVAREAGLPTVWGTVRKAGSGRVLFRGWIPIGSPAKCRTIKGIALDLVPRLTPCVRGPMPRSKKLPKPPPRPRAPIVPQPLTAPRRAIQGDFASIMDPLFQPRVTPSAPAAPRRKRSKRKP
jgi:hypothetical protein